jgi:ribonuclease P protein component
VARNRVRRRIRHILRAAPVAPGPGLDVLIVVRPSGAEATFDELRDALERLLGVVRSVTVPA